MIKVGKLVLLGTLTAFLLAGCSSERKDLIENGEGAHGKGDYLTAYSALSEAQKIKAFDKDEKETEEIYTDSINKLFETFKKDGDAAYFEADYDKAIEHFTNAKTIVSTDVYVNTQLENAVFMQENQEKFDKYGDFVVEILNESNTILREFSTSLDSFKVGVITEKDFVLSSKGLVPKSNEIVAKIDEAFYSIDETLIPIHQQLIDLVDYQHRTILNSVDLIDFADPVDTLRNDYLTIKKDQTNLIQEMKLYANTNKLSFNVTPGTDAKDTEAENKKSDEAPVTEVRPDENALESAE